MAIVRLADYRPAPYLLERTDLTVRLFADHAQVAARLAFEPNPAAEGADGRTPPGPLVLEGVELELLSLAVDGEPFVCIHCGRCISFCPHTCLEMADSLVQPKKKNEERVQP